MKSDENLPLLIDQSNETYQEIFEYESLKVKNISKNRSLKGSLFPFHYSNGISDNSWSPNWIYGGYDDWEDYGDANGLD
jgi:hypothetical protein